MKQSRIVALLFVSAIESMGAAARAEIAKPEIYNIDSYGAIGDGMAMETEAVPRTGIRQRNSRPLRND